MVRRLSCLAIVSLVALAVWSCTTPASAQSARSNAPGDLFYNYYVPPQGPGGVGAALYPCPRPTPDLVGHTYITYQALAPENFLYEHHRTYCRNNGDGSCTRTSVCWKCMPNLCHIIPGVSWSVPGQFGYPATPKTCSLP